MRYLILSDIHSNLAAFEAVLADAGSFDRIWCMGDMVGYGSDPNECLERLEPLPHICVAGNHDWASIDKLEITDFNLDAQLACLWTKAQLTPEHQAYLDALPEKIIEGEFTIVHGSPRHPIWEYLFSSSSAADNFEHFTTRFCFVGHTHMPVIFRNRDDFCETFVPEPDSEWHFEEERAIINPGSVGQPRDGDERASYVILDADKGTLTYRRVAYPVYVTQKRMLNAKLPHRLAARLAYGW